MEDGPLTIRLPFREPFDPHGLLGFLQPRAIPGVEEVEGRRYRRVVRAGRAVGVMELDAGTDLGAVILRVRIEARNRLDGLVSAARAVFDLDADPALINEVLGRDRLLAPLVRQQPGIRVPGAMDGYELGVRAILGQQVSVRGAITFARRLVERFGDPLPRRLGSLTHAFPTAEAIARADLSGLGLTGARARTLQVFSRAVAERQLEISRAADRPRTSAALLALPGIGPWTVAYIAMRGLRDPDAFPITDLGIRHALDRLGLPAGARDREAHTNAWRPWRAYAAMHLWASLGAG